MKRKYWTLLLLAEAAKSCRTLSAVRLQKLTFLLGATHTEEVGDTFYDHRPYRYGPFDAAVYGDVEELEREALAVVDSAGSWKEYGATLAGCEHARSLPVEDDVRDYVSRITEWALSLSFASLVRAIYDKYPEQQAHSVFRN